MSLWVIRSFFLLLCTVAGYAVSQYRPEIIEGGIYGLAIGFGLGGLLIALDEMLKGFSLRAFSAATFGLLLGTLIATMIDRTDLFIFADDKTRWLLRLGMFLGFGYVGMILAMRRKGATCRSLSRAGRCSTSTASTPATSTTACACGTARAAS